MRTGQRPEQEQHDPPVRVDRRRRRQHDPAVAITVNLPIALKEALDEVVTARGGTRSGWINIAVRAWLDREAEEERPA